MPIVFVENEPALIIDNKALVISDTHFGAPRISDIESVAYFINYDCNRLLRLVKLLKPSSLFVNGDIKEGLGVSAPYRVKEAIINCFNELISIGIDVYFILGNHDGKLSDWFPEPDFKFVKKYKLVSDSGSFLLTHGHKKIKEADLKGINGIISGHIHPGYNVSDGVINLVVKAWFTAEITVNDKLFYWIVIPSFSSLINGIALNTLTNDNLLRLSPFPASSNIISKKFFLLDLTPMF